MGRGRVPRTLAALVALAVAVAAPRGAPDAAEPNTVAAAMADFRAQMDSSGLRKLKAALALDPSDEECLRAVPKSDDPAIKRLLSRKGDATPFVEDLVSRADRARSSQAAVDAGLRWLAAHQADDGGWSSANFASVCDGQEQAEPDDPGRGHPAYDVGVTALAALAFLRAGYTPADVHPYGGVLVRALGSLRDRKDDEGCIGSRDSLHYLYGHAAATTALVEAYALTGDAALVEPARSALGFLVLAQNPNAGWRYGVRPGDSDTSMTAWCAMAFEAAKRAARADASAGRPNALPYPSAVETGIRRWITRMTDAAGRVGYTTAGTGAARPAALVDKFPAELTESMTAAGLCVRLFLGETVAKSAAMRTGIGLCLDTTPSWTAKEGGARDFYYWHYATHAFAQLGGAEWLRWRTQFARAVVPKQRTDGTPCLMKGSWDPLDVWGFDGGRVYSTAILVASLAEIVPASHRTPDPPLRGAAAPAAAAGVPSAPAVAVPDGKAVAAAWASLRAGRDGEGIPALVDALAADPSDEDVLAATPPDSDPVVQRLVRAGGDAQVAVEDALARAARARKVRDALTLSLRWLAAHQSPDGRWSAAGFASTCDGAAQPATPDAGPGRASNDVGVTALALSAFLDAGFSPKDGHPYAGTIARGVAWLVSQIDAQGVVGSSSGPDFLYRHGAATKALVDAYRRGGDPALVEPCRKAIDLLLRAQNPGAGWRYGIRPHESDSSLTGWIALAFESARRANDADAAASRPPTFPIPPEVANGMRSWFGSVTDPRTGRVGYDARNRFLERPDGSAPVTEATTAAGLCARLFFGESPTSPAVVAGVARLSSAMPSWKVPDDPYRDFYYWRFATHALRQLRGLTWQRWRGVLATAVLRRQVVDGDVCARKGSWDPVDPWGKDGGRVYSTAMLSIALAELATPPKTPPDPPLPTSGAPAAPAPTPTPGTPPTVK